MKTFFLLVVVLNAYTASAVPVQDQPEPVQARFFEYTDLNGDLHVIDLEEEPDMDVLNRVSRNADDNKFILFTRKNPNQGQELVINNAKSIRSSNFDPKVQTIVMAHGWNSDQGSGSTKHVKDAFLRRENANFIILDWSYLANSNYVTAVRGVPEIGRGLGDFLKFLIKTTKVSYDKIHLIGFSLGAHVVGNAGRALQGKVARVTGLDPAGPLWVTNSDKLRSGDAQYVEAIHTDGEVAGLSLGIGMSIADADFFPNGGSSQPGCLFNVCSHDFAWRLFAASVTYDHLVGRECSNHVQMTLNLCRGDNFNLGNNDLKKRGKNPNQGQELVINNAKSIRSSNFDPKVQTIVMAHGWNGNQGSGSTRHVEDAFLRRENANFIILDWSYLANSNYVTAVRGVPEIGRGLGDFLKFLIKTTKVSYDKIHLIGFSLGAHVVGNAGRALQGKVARVTGLDPAGPLWVTNSDKLRSGDAQYVEAIHTDGEVAGLSLGIGMSIADADFFPNGGSSQPGCLFNVCSHDFAWRLFAASVTYDHLVGRECSNHVQMTLNLCRGDNFNLGNNDLKKRGSGIFRVNTGRRYPF